MRGGSGSTGGSGPRGTLPCWGHGDTSRHGPGSSAVLGAQGHLPTRPQCGLSPTLKCEEHRGQRGERPGSFSAPTHLIPTRTGVSHSSQNTLNSRTPSSKDERPACTLSTKVSLGLPSAQPRQLGRFRAREGGRAWEGVRGILRAAGQAGSASEITSVWRWVHLALKQLTRAAFSSLPAALLGTGVMASPTSAFPILMLPASLVAPPGYSQVGTAAVPGSCEHQPSIPLTTTNPSTKVKC